MYDTFAHIIPIAQVSLKRLLLLCTRLRNHSCVPVMYYNNTPCCGVLRIPMTTYDIGVLATAQSMDYAIGYDGVPRTPLYH